MGDDGWMRLNFSHATPERIDEGIRRLAGLIATARGEGARELTAVS